MGLIDLHAKIKLDGFSEESGGHGFFDSWDGIPADQRKRLNEATASSAPTAEEQAIEDAIDELSSRAPDNRKIYR